MWYLTTYQMRISFYEDEDKFLLSVYEDKFLLFNLFGIISQVEWHVKTRQNQDIFEAKM
jgi:hypothetical protein